VQATLSAVGSQCSAAAASLERAQREELPSLEDLFPQPMQIWSEVASDGTTWAQYIRAHPTGEAVRRARRRFGVIGYNLPAPSAVTTSQRRREPPTGRFANRYALRR